MVTIAQRVEALRTERGMSRAALAEALGYPKTAFDRIESGRVTPTMKQQEQLADYFEVTVAYLRGESDARNTSESWIDRAFDEKAPEPVPAKPRLMRHTQTEDMGTVRDAFLKSASYKESIRAAVLEVLRSPEGKELLAKAVQEELARKGNG